MMAKISVITGDVVNYSNVSEKIQSKIEVAIQKVMEAHEEDLFENSSNFLIYRGDSFQIATSHITQSLAIAIQIRVAVKKQSAKSDVRLSIGIGQIQNNTGTINQSNGDVFLFSGRGLDEIGERRMAFKSDCENIDNHINMVLDVFAPIINNWTPEMSEAVELFMSQQQQVAIAKQIGISQSAVSKRLSNAKTDLLEQILGYYEEVIEGAC